jgi:hypothetical protein
MDTKSPAPRSALLQNYLSEKSLATELAVTVRTLARWRDLRIGPPYSRYGREVAYSIDAVRAWLAAGGTSGKSSSRRRRGS